jgi:tetratricopeptide (TPR) repeat protein
LLLALLAAGGYFGGRWALFDHHFRAARAALDEQDCDEARPHLDACLRLRPDSAEVHFLAARGLRRAGVFDESANHLRECQRLGGSTPETLLEWAMLGAGQGDLLANEPFLQERLAADAPEGGLILEALTQGSIEIYHLVRARYYLDRLLEREPDSALGLMWQGWLYETGGRREDALENYRRAVRAHPRHLEVRLRLGQLAVRHGDFAEAEEHLEYLRHRGYKRTDVLLALAQLGAQRGDLTRERAWLDELLAESPDNGNALVERGKLALQESKPEEAERDLRRAVELAPQDRQALTHLAVALSQQGKTREGDEVVARRKKLDAAMTRLEEIYKTMRSVPEDVPLWHEAGVICLRNDQDAEALRWFQGALQLNPAYGPAHESLAEYYDRAGDTAQAARERQLAAVGKR